MQGFNMGRYYPPDASAPPRFNTTTHPLGARAKKATSGILTVRFELPFAVWCSTCTPRAIIGQGVRFNAEKKKVGNYHSTPIWSFRMKHTACGGWWEIRTDPKAAEYVIVEGAVRRDYGEGKVGVEEEGELKMLTDGEKERRKQDAFARFEGGVEERTKERGYKERVEELYEGAETWRDPYEVNARLRRGFRVQRKVLRREEREKEGVQDKFSLGVEILGEIEEDGLRARMVEFGGKGTSEAAVQEATRRPLFETEQLRAEDEAGTKTKKLKAEVQKEKSRRDLRHALVENTRASIDPFLSVDAKSAPKMQLGLLKRKRETGDTLDATTSASSPDAVPSASTPAKKPPLATPLVEYDSD